MLGGWAILTEKLRALGVVTQAEAKTAAVASRAESKTKVVTIEGNDEKCLGKTVEGEKKAFMDVAREPAGRLGDALWLQVGGRELRGREEVLGRCLVGRWGVSGRWWRRRWLHLGNGGSAFRILKKA